MEKHEVHKTVRENYGKIAKQSSSNCCCGGSTSPEVSSCCGPNINTADRISKEIGYTDQDLKAVPEGANLGLGCGNPVALASLKEGEVVLDLGSGAGFDCFLSAAKVGPKGRIIGVDMTPEMLDKARENARKGNYTNVEFRLGEIENLPVADNSVDAIISNCVINLSADKKRVFEEAFRVLKPGGRLMVSDIVLTDKLPDILRNSIAAYVSCIAGALEKEEYLGIIQSAGFKKVEVESETEFPLDCFVEDPQAQAIVKKMKMTVAQVQKISSSILSIKVFGVKPE